MDLQTLDECEFVFSPGQRCSNTPGTPGATGREGAESELSESTLWKDSD